jgi:hypothetical protein
MIIKLIVTESDNGDSLSLPGEWRCESVDHDDAENSITAYEFDTVNTKFVEAALDEAGGVVSYFWNIDNKSAAAALGKLGGSSTSKRKAQASRQNGARGGRPRKTGSELTKEKQP